MEQQSSSPDDWKSVPRSDVPYEEALRASEALNRAVVENVAEGIFLVEAASKWIIQANPAFCRLLGYAEAVLARLTLYDLIAHDRAGIDANIARIVAAGHDAIGDRHYQRKDGALVTVEVSATALPQRDRTLLCAVVRDVTERRATEVALKASEAMLRAREAQLHAITDNLPILLFTLNPLGLITFAMGSGLAARGLTPERVIGRSIFADYHTPEVHAYVRRALDGETFTATVSGRGRVFATHYAPMRDEGRISGVSGIALDITEQVRAEAALRQLSSGLTPREREILPLLARKELTARQIGGRLHIEPSTVRTHIKQIADKLGSETTRRAVVAIARKRGLLSLLLILALLLPEWGGISPSCGDRNGDTFSPDTNATLRFTERRCHALIEWRRVAVRTKWGVVALAILLGATLLGLQKPMPVAAAGYMKWIDPYCGGGGGGADPGFHWWGYFPLSTGSAYSELWVDWGAGDVRVDGDPGYQQTGADGTIQTHLFSPAGTGDYRGTIYYTGSFMGVESYSERKYCW